MRVEHLDRRDTFFHNDFLEAYYYSEKLNHLRSYSPNLAEIKNAIDAKANFSEEKRRTLVTDLFRQYSEANIDLEENPILYQKIRLLENSNTFSITTGQQIHIGLGPLYVLYKVLDILAIAQECKQLYPDYNFVPIFWMASEDHDIEEIQTLSLYKQNFTWQTSQSGAVGRMKTDGIAELFEQIKTNLNLSEAQHQFMDLCQNVYAQSANLSIAFRKLLHHLFADQGLVVLDADSANLKKEFITVLRDELKGKNYKSLRNSTQQLIDAGFEKKLVIRECNLFFMDQHTRKKVSVLKKEDSEIEKYVDENYFNLSPNAALRPLYQEWILPNLVYVGGPSEIYYWSQLKGIFDNYKMPIPILHLRSSNIIVPEKFIADYSNIGLKDYFDNDQHLIALANREQEGLLLNIRENFDAVTLSLVQYKELIENSLNGFSLESKMAKLLEKLNEINEITESQFITKSIQNPSLNKLLKTKVKYFNPVDVQERSEAIVNYIEVIQTSLRNLQSPFGMSRPYQIGIFMI